MPQSPIPIPCPFGILRPVQPPEDIMDMPSTPPRRSDRNFAWTAFNAVQFAFTLAWTAAWISAALLVHVVLRNRHWPLRMAARCWRSEEHTSELQSLMRHSYAVFCLTKKQE